jgi:hypothetical protein
MAPVHWLAPGGDVISRSACHDLPPGHHVAEPVIDQSAVRIVGRDEEEDARSRRRPLQDPFGEALKLTPLGALLFSDGREGTDWPERSQNRPGAARQKSSKGAGGDDRSETHLDTSEAAGSFIPDNQLAALIQG